MPRPAELRACVLRCPHPGTSLWGARRTPTVEKGEATERGGAWSGPRPGRQLDGVPGRPSVARGLLAAFAFGLRPVPHPPVSPALPTRLRSMVPPPAPSPSRAGRPPRPALPGPGLAVSRAPGPRSCRAGGLLGDSVVVGVGTPPSLPTSHSGPAVPDTHRAAGRRDLPEGASRSLASAAATRRPPQGLLSLPDAPPWGQPALRPRAESHRVGRSCPPIVIPPELSLLSSRNFYELALGPLGLTLCACCPPSISRFVLIFGRFPSLSSIVSINLSWFHLHTLRVSLPLPLPHLVLVSATSLQRLHKLGRSGRPCAPRRVSPCLLPRASFLRRRRSRWGSLPDLSARR